MDNYPIADRRFRPDAQNNRADQIHSIMTILWIVIGRHGTPIMAEVAKEFEVGRIPSGAKIRVEFHKTDAEAQRKINQLGIKPIVRYHRGKVSCVTPSTIPGVPSQIYDNAAAAARAIGVSPAVMSMHLNNRKRYPTLKGMVFERIDE